MDLKAAFQTKYSKTQNEKVVNWIGKSQDRFDQLLKLFLSDQQRVRQIAGWALSDAAIKHPELVKKHAGKLINVLGKPELHEAIKRNIVRTFQYADIPDRYHGEIMDACIHFIESPVEKVAVKAFSMAVLQRLLPLYPDIHNELKLIIHERWDHETPAFHSRARKILAWKPKP